MSNIEPSGLLLIDKPQNFTSNDVVAVARRVLGVKRMGHSGTLDPMATGLLILLVGRKATRLQSNFLKLPKVYRAQLVLGAETDTWDAQGHVIRRLPVPDIDVTRIQAAVKTLSGEIRQQIPPFSAKKINGRKMYELARRGQEMQARFNTVQISAWEDIVFDGKNNISFTLHCSCGTYVRAVGLMLARALGTTGHLSALRRTRIGNFDVQEAFDGGKLKTTPREELLAFIREAVC